METYFDVLRCAGERKMVISNFALSAILEAVNPEKLRSGGQIKKGYKEKVPGGALCFIPEGKNFITYSKGVDSGLLKIAVESEYQKLKNKK